MTSEGVGMSISENTVENPWLAGNFGPVSGEVTATALAVEGRLPTELEGRLLRTASPGGPWRWWRPGSRPSSWTTS